MALVPPVMLFGMMEEVLGRPRRMLCRIREREELD